MVNCVVLLWIPTNYALIKEVTFVEGEVKINTGTVCIVPVIIDIPLEAHSHVMSACTFFLYLHHPIPQNE